MSFGGFGSFGGALIFISLYAQISDSDTHIQLQVTFSDGLR